MTYESEYYLEQKPLLLEEFNEFVERIGKYLSRYYGEEFSKKAVIVMKDEFDMIVPEIPFIGGNENPMTPNLLSSVRYLMVYRVLKSMGKDLKDIGQMCYEQEEEFFKNNSEFIPPMCNPNIANWLKKSAADSGKYPGDFVYTYVDGEGFDVGLDFTECALLKFYKKYGADDFMPYLCAMDIPMSKYGNLGLHRTKTLADGCDICDFRYKAGRETNVASEVVKKE